MKTLSVVIPVYYNEESLPLLFRELSEVEKQLSNKGVALEVIFVDDGSGDGSFDAVMKIRQQRPETKVIRLSRNFGAVHASKAGLGLVTGDCFLLLAADLQDPPGLILEAVEHWLKGSKFVLCARTNRDDPFPGKLLAAIYYRLLRALVVPDYPNIGYDLALMDKALLPYLKNSSKNVNLPLFAYWLGFKPDIIFYERRKREHGKSRWTFAKRFKLFIDSLLGFSVVPIRLISLIGFVVSVMSLIYGVVIVVNTIRGEQSIRGFPTIVALMAFLLGLIICMLGIIGEYLWRIFDELNSRPESVIDEIYDSPENRQ